MASELIEVSILLAALNKDMGEISRLLKTMSREERRRFQLAIFKIEDVIDDMDQDESLTAIGMGKEVKNG